MAFKVPSGQEQGRSGVLRSSQASQPARVTLTGQKGDRMNININKITGSVTVSNKSTVVHHGMFPRSNEHSDSDSSSDSSDSDSDAQRFFTSVGAQMPTKRQWKEMDRNMRQMEKNMKEMKTDHNVETLIVEKNVTKAFDGHGNPVKLLPQTVNTRSSHNNNFTANSPLPGFINPVTNMLQNWQFFQKEATPSSPSMNTSGQVPVNCKLDQTRDKPTKYEVQTQTFKKVMSDLKLTPSRIIDERTIQKITPHFGKGWRRVFRHLKISDVKIDSMFQDHGQLQETVHNLLILWTRSVRSPDMKTLVEALVRAEQISIVRHLQD